MQAYKKIFVLSGLFVLIITGISATHRSNEQGHYKNLKVLSNHISDEQLERVMFSFQRQLGVTCLYCHVRSNDTDPEKSDFASDEKKEKRIAREMLRMTLKINKKYFDIAIDKKIVAKPVVWCKTCHRGLPVPRIQR